MLLAYFFSFDVHIHAGFRYSKRPGGKGSVSHLPTPFSPRQPCWIRMEKSVWVGKHSSGNQQIFVSPEALSVSHLI